MLNAVLNNFVFTCRNSHPQYVGKAKIATEVLGEMMNGFVDPLTFKAMV